MEQFHEDGSRNVDWLDLPAASILRSGRASSPGLDLMPERSTLA